MKNWKISKISKKFQKYFGNFTNLQKKRQFFFYVLDDYIMAWVDFVDICEMTAFYEVGAFGNF